MKKNAACEPKLKATSLSIPAALAAQLDARRADGETRSARMAADLQAYYAGLDAGLIQARKILSGREALLILGAQSAAFPEPREHWYTGLAHRVADACDLDGLDAKWGVDKATLLDKLARLEGFGQAALVEWAARTWGTDWQQSEVEAFFRG